MWSIFWFAAGAIAGYIIKDYWEDENNDSTDN